MNVEGLRTVRTQVPPAATEAAAAPEQARPEPQAAARGRELPYTSPVLQYDSRAAIAVLMFRDSETGDVESQYPPERVVREYRLRTPTLGPSKEEGEEAAAAAAAALRQAAGGSARRSDAAGGAPGRGGDAVGPAITALAGAPAGAAPVNFVA